MPKVHLSDLSIRALKATGKQQKYWCALTPNFGLLLSQAGGKSFFFMAPKTRRRIPLGKWPATPVKQARDAARRLLLDPQSAWSPSARSRMPLRPTLSAACCRTTGNAPPNKPGVSSTCMPCGCSRNVSRPSRRRSSPPCWQRRD